MTLTPPSQKDPVSEKDFRFLPLGIPCEWAESYHPGGLHPIHFGDVLKDRYRIIRKLGNGSFATVWLALDLTATRYVALKVHRAGLDESRQLQIQSMLATKAPHDPNSRFVVTLLDSFTHKGPNGSHLCLVIEPMGPSVSAILNAPIEDYDPLNPQPRRFPKDRVKRILRQVLLALQFLHGNGVVHGDLQSGNILFAIKDLSSVKPEVLSQTATNSRIEHLQKTDGKVDLWAPSYLAVGMPLSDFVLEGDDEIVKIIDMGGAFMESNPPDRVVTPASLRAPESILGCSVGKGIDVWSVGCILFELLTGLPLFQIPPLNDSDELINDDHLIQLTDIIGPLPEGLLSRWTRASKYYDANGGRLDAWPWDFDMHEGSDGGSDTRLSNNGENESDTEKTEDESADDDMDDWSVGERDPPKPHDSLEVLFHTNKAPDISEEEEKVIVSLLVLIFRYNPHERPTITELLDHRWFNKA